MDRHATSHHTADTNATPQTVLLTALRDALISGGDYGAFEQAMTAAVEGMDATSDDPALARAIAQIRHPPVRDEMAIAARVLITLHEDHPTVLHAVQRSEAHMISRDEAMGHLADAAHVLREIPASPAPAR